MAEERSANVTYATSSVPVESVDLHGSGASWSAVFAGAVAAAALALILIVLGVGLGFSAVSPWDFDSGDATAIGISTAIWLAFTQIAASGLGGYLAGRLRMRWPGLESDEVYFRDTAHGLLAWAVGALFVAALMGSAVSGLASSGARALGAAASTVTQAAGSAAAGSQGGQGGAQSGAESMMSYFIDALFRSDQPGPAQDPQQARAEATTIFLKSMADGALAPTDQEYLATIVARETGLTPEEAAQRVQDRYAQASAAVQNAKVAAKEAADTARKAAAGTALWMFVALLSGAFFAAWAAVWGGRRREALSSRLVS